LTTPEEGLIVVGFHSNQSSIFFITLNYRTAHVNDFRKKIFAHKTSKIGIILQYPPFWGRQTMLCHNHTATSQYPKNGAKT
jgi:hypothetical protein